MAILDKWYPSTWRGRPASMPGGDWSVWQRFLAWHPTKWPEYAYDVEIHGGPTPIVDADPLYARTWARLIAKRVDAIGRRRGQLTLIEIRTRAAWQSIGQLIGYRRLFPIDYPDELIEGVAIVTDYMDDKLQLVAAAEGINVIIVPDLEIPGTLKPPIPEPQPPA